ncbi:hypothetical protein HBI56_158580 [Parastagonospora nodorum]|nr:hypothetical protein HBH56_189300 [Parastagonospora nodorum]KAH3925110.1 hypothetical protein HBH54_185110 [Parastagonospora nodorum]KAH3967807.1 hypothetical protein HBH52_183990 [Parastagonospora nodorum]KAH3994583.1 hypothetical protein HBI10_183630 [Parastagonospora nodorum]KAH4091263.1 hypothetical protein HBH48_090140 [Parastagonospora nodorum]
MDSVDRNVAAASRCVWQWVRDALGMKRMVVCDFLPLSSPNRSPQTGLSQQPRVGLDWTVQGLAYVGGDPVVESTR